MNTQTDNTQGQNKTSVAQVLSNANQVLSNAAKVQTNANQGLPNAAKVQTNATLGQSANQTPKQESCTKKICGCEGNSNVVPEESTFTGGKGKKKSASKPKKSSPKKGGALVEDLSRLAVPFGLLLAKHSMQKFLSREAEEKKAAPKKPAFDRRRVMGGEELEENQNQEELNQEQNQNGGNGCGVLPKMGGKKKSASKAKKSEPKAKKGGADASIESLLEDLAVPVGLMLAERGTRMYINRDKKKAEEKKPKAKVGGEKKEKKAEKEKKEKKAEEKK